jgi:hypothetical protein
MIDIDKIEAAAKSAPPSRWLVEEWGLFHATANPQAVLEMVSMIRERDAVLRQALEAFDAVAGKGKLCDAAIAAIKGVLND